VLYEGVCGDSIPAGPVPLSPLDYKIASNLCKDLWKSAFYRRERSHEDEQLSAFSDKNARGQDTVTSIMEKQWEREAVIRALEQLDEEDRQIVILRFYEDLKLEEIAEMMEMNLNTLKSRLYKSFRLLAEILQREEEDAYEYGKKIKSPLG
jgi:RNA polymerase sigma factor (sigma-70 family)